MLIDLFMGESCPFSVIFCAKLNYLRWLSPFYIFAKFILDSCDYEEIFPVPFSLLSFNYKMLRDNGEQFAAES
jgi:hypothetical protein